MSTHTFIERTAETGPAVSSLKPGVRQAEIAVAGQWTLIWGKFTRHKVAVVAAIVIGLLYFIALFAEFLAPGLPDTSKPQFTYSPPQEIRLFTTQPDGSQKFQLHVTGYGMTV